MAITYDYGALLNIQRLSQQIADAATSAMTEDGAPQSELAILVLEQDFRSLHKDMGRFLDLLVHGQPGPAPEHALPPPSRPSEGA